jgi:DNA repair exonuclease SbcCD ATPase subunit
MGVQTSVKPNGHMPHARIAAAEATCPTCKQPISKSIQTRIAAEEKARQERFIAELHAAKIKAAEAAQREVDKVKKDALAAVAETCKQAQLERNAYEKSRRKSIYSTRWRRRFPMMTCRGS